MESQSVKATGVAGIRGYHGGKNPGVRKPHILAARIPAGASGTS